jgi:cellobiose phosphorylase
MRRELPALPGIDLSRQALVIKRPFAMNVVKAACETVCRAWSNEFCDQIAFADLAGRQTAWTADRAEFLGRNGTLDRPLGLAPGVQLSNRVGAGLDPCGALQAQLTPDPGGSIDVIFFLGESAAEPRRKR